MRRIAESAILSDEELDLLAQTFLSAGDAVYSRVPDEWFGDDAIEIEIGPAPQQGAANAAIDPDRIDAPAGGRPAGGVPSLAPLGRGESAVQSTGLLGYVACPRLRRNSADGPVPL